METSKAEPLDVVVTLNRLIRLMQDRGLDDTAQFLAMARTQFLIEANGVSDAEFRALCDWLDGKQPGSRPGATPSRGRRDGNLRIMRRAWQCASVGRGRRRAAANQT
jgi:hypothetical protein